MAEPAAAAPPSSDELAPLLFLTGFHRLSWSGKFGGSKRIGEQRVRGSLRCEISTQLTAA
jgi:hypothetical protein